MSALERLKDMPDWPARMTAPIAAAYMGVSQTTFLSRFGDRSVREGSNVFWARAQLDRFVADQFGLDTPSVPAAEPVDDYVAWKAGRWK